MMQLNFLTLILAAMVLAFVQVAASIPWQWAMSGKPFRKWISDNMTLSWIGGALVLVTVWLTIWLLRAGESQILEFRGRIYWTVLHAQLIADFVVLAPRLLLLFWPKGGAVAIAAMRESLRQPMFWTIAILGSLLIVTSMVIPYFTMGDDYKLMKQVGYDAVMLFSALFGLLAASISINEEIEGRTAITVISKPINRRQFLIGKYLGFLMACWTMTLILGFTLCWALYYKPRFDPLDDVADPMPIEVSTWLTPKVQTPLPTPEAKSMAVGIAKGCGEAIAHHIGLFRVFGQVMIMLSICVALATRMQFIVNLVVCLGIFMVGNLSPIMVHVTSRPDVENSLPYQIVNFLAKLFNAVFPALDSFDMGPAIIRDMPLGTIPFLGFVLTVLAYSALYTLLSLLAGLLLFEDRDLA